MVRIKRGNVARKRRKKVLRIAKGFRGTHSRLFRVANAQVMKALKYSYVGRKQKKRQFRRLWITRINAKVRSSNEGMNYSLFMNKLKTSLGVLGLFGLVLVWFASSLYQKVPAGYVGVATLFGEVQEDPYEEGLHIPVNPFIIIDRFKATKSNHPHLLSLLLTITFRN